MATQLGNLNGDLSDITDVDFAKVNVRIRANTPYVIDPDNNKVRLTGGKWKPAAADGLFTFSNLIVAADSFVDRTLQYWVDIKPKGGTDQDITPLGPFILAPGDQDITDLVPQIPVDFNSQPIDTDVLSEAEDYTDIQLAGHVAGTNPHPQYAVMIDGSGNVIGNARIMVQAVGSPFNPDAIPDKTLVVRTS